jgi:acid phosphatase (class A)
MKPLLLCHASSHASWGCRFLSVMVLATASATSLSAQSALPVTKPAKQRIPKYLDPSLLDLSLILPPPPAQDSGITRAELAEIHHIEQTRTPAQVAAAQVDDHREDLFLYSTVLGEGFNAEALPATAIFSANLRNDVGVVDPPLKALYARPRPYNFDTTLQPVCDVNKEGSYPSGHSFNGYLFAFVLLQMVPEKRAEIMARADDYAHNRMICEAHYASDLEASRRAAYATIGAMLANARFQRDLAVSRAELRQHLALPAMATK